MADVLAEYNINFTPSYEQFFSLWLNIERVRARKSFDAARACWVANGDEKLPDDWITATNNIKSEVGKWRIWSLNRDVNKNSGRSSK